MTGIGSLCALAAAIAVAIAAGPAASSGRGALPVGSLSLGAASPVDAPAEFTARAFTVRCPGVAQRARGIVATGPALAKARGVVMF